MPADEPTLRDGWTHDEGYKRCYQTGDDVETAMRLLALERACAMADVGCGNGAFAIAAARAHPALQVWAFDGLESAIAQCRTDAQGLPNLHAETAWAHSVPLADASVDRVLFRSVLHHIGEPQAVYDEIARLLRPGGLLVLQAPCNYWEQSFGEVLSGMMMLNDDSHPRFYYRPEQVVDGLRKAGLCPGDPECWTYLFPFLGDAEAQFIRDRQAEERLHLQPTAAGKWTIENYWVRVVAGKAGM